MKICKNIAILELYFQIFRSGIQARKILTYKRLGSKLGRGGNKNNFYIKYYD